MTKVCLLFCFDVIYFTNTPRYMFTYKFLTQYNLCFLQNIIIETHITALSHALNISDLLSSSKV